MSTSTLLLVKKVATQGTLNKGTWDHCVFNAVGDEYGINVNGFKVAKAVDPTARDFITYWDSHRDYTTENLLDDVTKVLDSRTDIPEDFNEVNMGRVSRIRRRTLFKSNLLTTEAFEQELEALLESV